MLLISSFNETRKFIYTNDTLYHVKVHPIIKCFSERVAIVILDSMEPQDEIPHKIVKA